MARVESRYLCVDEPRVEIGVLPSNMFAAYSHGSNKITFNVARISCTGERALQGVAHEVFHSYCYKVLETPEVMKETGVTIDDGTLKKISAEFGGAYVIEGPRYYSQASELQAREYAEQSLEDISHRVELWRDDGRREELC